MALHITQIGKHRYACGLFWQSLSRPRELVKEARELGAKIDCDLMAVRTDSGTAQAGFAHSREGGRRGMVSLGAAIAATLAEDGIHFDGRRQRVHNWLAALKLPDGRWVYFAVRDANFLPNGDFAGTRDEVLDRLHGDYGLGGWNVVIGDEELADHGFHHFAARSLPSLLPQRKNGGMRLQRWWRLQQVQASRSWPRVLAAALALALAGAAVAGWMVHQRRQEERQRELSMAAVRERLRQAAHLPPPPPPPWYGQPRPRDLLAACAARFTWLTPGGWQLDEFGCGGGQVRHAWSRGLSTAAFLLAQVPDARVDLSGERAERTEALDLAADGGEELLERQKVLEPLLAELQLMGVAPRISEAAAGAPAQPGAAGWRSYAFKFKTGALTPALLAAALDKPGVRVTRLLYQRGEWSIEGVMYVK